MNRTDRLYALVEELRACAPRRLAARELAARYEVSVRTIERDIGALQQAGVPIFADVGRGGGYTLDKSRTLPPLNFTPAEAVAVAITLSRAGGCRRTPAQLAPPSTRSSPRCRLTTAPRPASWPPASASRPRRERRRGVRAYRAGGGRPDPPGGPPHLRRPDGHRDGARRRAGHVHRVRQGLVPDRLVPDAGGCRIFRTDRVRRAALLEETAPTAPPSMHDDIPSDYVVRPWNSSDLRHGPHP